MVAQSAGIPATQLSQFILSALMAVIVGLCGWTLHTVNGLASDQAVLQERIATMQKTISTSAVDSQVIASLSRESGAIAGRVEALEAGLSRNWPRDRVQDSNIKSIVDFLHGKFPDQTINIRVIEDF